MKIALIGAGNLASHLATALHRKGSVIVQVYSRHFSNAEALARKIDAEALDDLSQLDSSIDVLIFAVSDHAIPTLLECLGRRNDSLLIHTAGSVALDVFRAYSENYAVLYPLQTFSKAKPIDFSEIPVFIEANSEAALSKTKLLAGMLSDNVREANSQQRKQLHLAAVFACNFTNHLYELSSQLTEAAKLPFEVLLPLIRETADKLRTLSPHDAQTGPAVRNNWQVMEEHMRLLEERPDLQKLYELLSESIIKRHLL